MFLFLIVQSLQITSNNLDRHVPFFEIRRGRHDSLTESKWL